MEIKAIRSKPEKVVYAQLRQASRNKAGKLVVKKTIMLTIHDATVEQIETIMRASIKNKPVNPTLERSAPNGNKG